MKSYGIIRYSVNFGDFLTWLIMETLEITVTRETLETLENFENQEILKFDSTFLVALETFEDS